MLKASAWYVAFNIQNEWRLTRIPKLSMETRLEKEGLSRYEQYKEDRKVFNSNKVRHKSIHGVDTQDKPTKGRSPLFVIYQTFYTL